MKTAVSQTGTITFKLNIDKSYYTGYGQEDYCQCLVKLPGVTEIAFRRVDSVINISWTWECEAKGSKHLHGITTDFSELNGPKTYFFQYTWDSTRGLSEGYLNGQPLRIPGNKFKPWWVEKEATTFVVGKGRLHISDVAVEPYYTPPYEAKAAVPEEFLKMDANLIGFTKTPVPIDVKDRYGGILYESLMNDPEALKDWVKEGTSGASFENGYMLLNSLDFPGHVVLWCPQDFPESFIAEWEFEPITEHGLAIVFFCAQGENGEDIFDNMLPKRDGTFNHYITGAIKSYHISYFANLEELQMGRPDSNLRKNNHFYRVSGGPIAIHPGTKGWLHMRLIKAGNRIQLFANDKISVDWTDDNIDRYGPPHGCGKIGLRQMETTIGAYRNFRVWELIGKVE